MDYYQQARQQVPTAMPQNQNQHYVYAQQTAAAASHAPQVYYQQAAAMGHQQQQAAAYQQQQHYAPQQQATQQQQQQSANTSMDYGSPQQQQQAHNQSAMSAHSQAGNGGRGGRGAPRGAQHAADAMQHPQARFVPAVSFSELPLRIVIDSKHVGAIIGQAGATIREITRESKARVMVDTQRTVKDAQGHSEKIISINGSQENCSKACVKIMEIVQRELEKDETRENNEVELKVRAHNQLVGRLIGKQGATIKKIMQETGTNISVSNDSSSRPEMSGMMGMMPPFPDMISQMERTITVRGPTIENVTSAEQKISVKLRQSYDTDVHNRMTMPVMPGGVPGLVTPLGDAYSLMGAMRPAPPMMSNVQNIKETKMWVPNSMVGAIIGAKGTHIRNIMRQSGANIRIEGGGEKKEKGEGEEKETKETEQTEEGQGDNRVEGEQAEKKEKEDDRLVTLSGTDMQQLQAQYYIFQKVAEQSQHYMDEVRGEVKLRIELNVPARLVGRIIGKGGQNVRELQRITGATVKIPDEEGKHGGERGEDEETKESGSSPAEPSAAPSPDATTVVRVVGNCQATHLAQVRIGKLISEFNRMAMNEKRRENEAHGDSGRKQSSPPNNGGDASDSAPAPSD